MGQAFRQHDAGMQGERFLSLDLAWQTPRNLKQDLFEQGASVKTAL